MDLFTAILACSLYRDDALVRGIAESNSRGNPYALLDATLPADAPGQPSPPRSLDAAAVAMQKIIDFGGEPLLGFMQVPSSWATLHHKRPEDLFDPCTNIAIGTAKLSELEYDCRRASGVHRPATHHRSAQPTPPGVRRCVVHKYAEAIHQPEFELVVLLELEHGPPLRLASSEVSAPILSQDRAASSFAGAALFFDLGRPSLPSPLVDPFAQDASAVAPSRELPPREAVFDGPSPAPSQARTPVQPSNGAIGHREADTRPGAATAPAPSGPAPAP